MSKSWSEIELLLHEDVKTAVRSLNFPTMTPVQAATIPKLLVNKDVAAQAVTGSGKTLAFLIPLLEMLQRRGDEEPWKTNQIAALVISPTQELAVQIHTVLKDLLVHVKGLTHGLFVGGRNIENDVKSLKKTGANIVVCTPGRFEDLLTRQKSLNLPAAVKHLEFLVLDEADRLLDLGFQNSLDTILSYLPKQRRTGLFSATQTKEVMTLVRAGLRNPVLVTVTEKTAQSTPLSLENYYILTKDAGKLATLINFLEEKNVCKALLFVPTCACVDYWSSVLKKIFSSQTDLPISAIHGKMKQKRNKVLEAFRTSTKGLLICTDVMARGIDIPEVDWVVQWDPPANASSFVHRIGRTARQGHKGSAVVLLLKSEEAYIEFIWRNQKVKLEQLEDTAADEEIKELTDKLRTLQQKDRLLMEKGVRAYVSHIRAYSKHECSLLLKTKELPMASVAMSYGLLQLPKMPELKTQDISNFVPANVDFDAIPYKDKQREEQRLSKLKQYKQTGVWPGAKVKKHQKNTEPWSKAKQFKEQRRVNKLKRKKENKAAEGPANKKKKKNHVTEEEIAELAKDIALCKKLKKKKISDEDFEKQIGIS